MAIAKLDPPPRSDFGHKIVSWEKRHAAGKDLRREVPRESHAEWIPSSDRPDPLKLIAENNKAGKRTSFRCAWDVWPPRRSPSCGAQPA